MSENAKRLLTLLMAISIVVSVLPMSVSAQEQAAVEPVTTTPTEIVEQQANTVESGVDIGYDRRNDTTNTSVTLYCAGENLYVTGTAYIYTSASGTTKTQLTLSENEADALAMEMITNSDGTISFESGSQYLFCDGTNVQFVSEQDDYTKFVLESAGTEGSYFIKCAVATYNGNPQYLEIYKGYLTCYGMGYDTSIYTFELKDASGVNGSSATYPQLELDVQQNAVISAEGEYAVLAFTPAEDGTYIFTSHSSSDTYGYLCDSYMNELSSDDDAGEGTNFAITYSLSANTTYYLKARFYSNSTGSFPVSVRAAKQPQLESITFTPVTIVERTNGYDYGSYWYYDEWDALYKSTYTATFADGTVLNESGSGFNYDGVWYSFSCGTNQSSSNPWTAGNTYAITVTVLDRTTLVPVTIRKSPVVDVALEPIILEEHKGGYWNGDYYYYSWKDQVKYTVTFDDGTTATGTYWNPVYHNGIEISASSCSDNQSQDAPWLSGNTYSATIQIGGKQYTAYISIQKTVEDNSFEYAIQNNQVVITGCTSKTEILQIPEMIDGYPVTGIIGLGTAPRYAKELRIPDCVTMLSSSALQGSWEKITIGSGVVNLGSIQTYAMWNLKEIVVSEDNPAYCSIEGVLYNKAVTQLIYYPMQKKDLHIIPDSVKDVDILFNGSGNFSGVNFRLGSGVVGYKEVDGVIYNEDMTKVLYCTSAATGKYVMPESVTEIESLAFMNSSLKDVTISPNVTEITYMAFQGSSIESITIPGSVTQIDLFAFSGCDNLQKVNILDIAAWCTVDIESNPLSYGDLYINGVLTKDLVIPDVVTRVYPSVFSGSSITSVTIPSSVTRVDPNAFSRSSLISVTIPSSMEWIGYNAFANCNSLEKVCISDVGAWCDISFGNTTANPLYYAKNLYLNGKLVTDLVLTEDAPAYISNYAFINSSFTSVTVPSCVYTIGDNAFAYSALESITFEEGIQSINSNAFVGSALKSVDFPDSLVYIRVGAFKDCEHLEQVTFGSGLQYVAYHAFENSGLKSLDLPDNVVEMEEGAFINIQASQIRLPNSVTDISYRAFAFNKYLVSVTIPTGVQSINYAAFEETSLSHVLYLGTEAQWAQVQNDSPEVENAIKHFNATGEEIIIQETCTTIRYYCEICNVVETLRKPDNAHTFVNDVCTTCGQKGQWEYMINKNKGTAMLTEYLGSDKVVTLPSMIEGYPVTSFTSNLFAYNKTIKEVILPDTITQIGAGAFMECSFLEKITAGSNLQAIGDNAFYNCRKLRSVDLPEGLVSIGSHVFFNCNLTEIDIPSTVTSIGDYAFYSCELTKVEIPAGVTQIAYYAFASNYNLKEVTLPDTLQSIGWYAFYGSQINEVTIPASVTEIGTEAFFLYNDWSESDKRKLILFQGDMPTLWDNWLNCSDAVAFYPASASGWEGISYQNFAWYACALPEILKQPVTVEATKGQSAVFTVEAYGQRLSYQWYVAAPGSKEFVPVGGNNFELTLIADETTIGSRVYCVVTDVLGQTTQTEIAELQMHNHTFEDGVCTGCGEIEPAGPEQIAELNLDKIAFNLGAKIGVQFALNNNNITAGGYEKAYVKVSMNVYNTDGTYEVQEMILTEGQVAGKYLVFIYSAAPKLMGREMTVQGFAEKNGKEYCGAAQTYSLKQGIMDLLASNYATSNDTSKTAAAREKAYNRCVLLVDMLYYGAEAQTRFAQAAYDGLVTDGLDAKYAALKTTAEPTFAAINTPMPKTENELFGLSLGVADAVELQFTFTLTAGEHDKYTVKVTCAGVDYLYTSESFQYAYKNYPNRATIVCGELAAKQMRDQVTVVLLKDGKEVSQTYTTSIESVATAMGTTATNKNYALARAMMTYGDSAKVCFG